MSGFRLSGAGGAWPGVMDSLHGPAEVLGRIRCVNFLSGMAGQADAVFCVRGLGARGSWRACGCPS